ncbi:hypothetical protein L9F63_006902 [Diploptera punctata]|uniref:BolA-like protein DDB_G0274169 n=1 Tax=Diploptera punctata TaxID=6984 RepID=A0AAD7Z9G0_DIPPU|nr:hypothetical protein L9F63_006902 [Diploptera punctata]
MITLFHLKTAALKVPGKLELLPFTVSRIYSQQSKMIGESSESKISNPIECAVRRKLAGHLEPFHLDVLNESYMHNVPPGAETHFKVIIVSEKFDNVPLIKRHRMVNEILKDELQNGVHALSIVVSAFIFNIKNKLILFAKTPSQWEESSKTVSPSPACRGGFGK